MQFVLFDMGGVFFQKDEQEWNAVLRQCDVTPEALHRIRASDLYQTYKRGDMTESDFLESVRDLFPEDWAHTPRHLFMSLCLARQLNKSLVAALDQLRRDYRVGVLSNSDSFLELRLKQFGIYDRFEFVINSYRIRMKKPDPAIFRYALDKIGLPADEILFIDDKPANIAAAESLGMHGHVFVSTADLTTALPEYGINSLAVPNRASRYYGRGGCDDECWA